MGTRDRRTKTEVGAAAPAAAPAGATIARIGFVKSALEQFNAQPHTVREKLKEKLKALALAPESGKPLVGPLQGCYRVTYGRIRCVARVADGVAVVLVLVVTVRKAQSPEDAYALATELILRDPIGVRDLLAQQVQAFMMQHARPAPRSNDETPPKKRTRKPGR